MSTHPAHSGFTVATVNVNGIRAAVRRGMGAWLEQRRPDILTLQEVRAGDDVLTSLLEGALGPGWHLAHAEPTDAGTKGRAGVAVATRLPVGETRDAAAAGLGERWAGSGRWVELDVEVPSSGGGGAGTTGAETTTLTVISAYVHSGEAGTVKQEAKQDFLDAVTARMTHLRRRSAEGGAEALLTGDLNIAHTEADIKNWRGNRGKAGFLPQERAHLDTWFASGWVDVVRALHPEEPHGPYSWWSWRGQAFDNDTGWRIDHQVATPGLAARAQEAVVDRAPIYAERFSDHAPVAVRYAASPSS